MDKTLTENWNKDDNFINEIFNMNNTKCYVDFRQISDNNWRRGVAKGRSHMLVQHSINLNHLPFLGSKEAGIQEF